jgi:NAD(P)H-hydrate epimerase
MGAGYITVATTAAPAAALRISAPTVPLVELPETGEGFCAHSAETTALLTQLLAASDAALIGPGLGRSPQISALLHELLSTDGSSVPVLLDADALYAFSPAGGGSPELLPTARPLILTPHVAELARLTAPPATPAALRRDNITLVAKGPVTRITTGSKAAEDSHGPSALATAGSGDVLAGIIAALLAQGLSPYDGATLGVRLQAKAALAGVDALTALCLNARDLVDFLPDAVRELTKGGGL